MAAAAALLLALCCRGASSLSASIARPPWAPAITQAAAASALSPASVRPAPAPSAAGLDGGALHVAMAQAAPAHGGGAALPQARASVLAGPALEVMVGGAEDAGSWAKIFFGALLLLIAAPIHWFNEERSARIDALLCSGLEDAVRAEAAAADAALRGRLVHVQGRARAAAPVKDIQFRDAVVAKCLKLQSTVEVLQWVERPNGVPGRLFDTEWTTVHHDNLQPKPSPQNPKPPARLALGTFTQSCPRVELGAYVLTEDMVNYFQRFQPAMHLLPERVTCAGMTFFANPEDGYYYGRSGLHTPFGTDRDKLLFQHTAGDIRVRFMYVPETDATVVAVQCHKDGAETFVPYRPVPLRPCAQDQQARRLRIEEGDRSARIFNRNNSCCAAGGLAGCCCCACNAIACVCESEVVTEEICYVSDRLEPLEKPFHWAVHRSPWRVWNFRALGLLAMFLGMRMVLSPFAVEIAHMEVMAVYGSAAPLIAALTATLGGLLLITAAATAVYRPAAALRWALAAAFVLAAPLMFGSQHGPPPAPVAAGV